MRRTTPARKPRGDRRQLVADTALAVLASLGARGLTHRAVDDEAGLPRGSTSYYFRTRDRLVAAAATRLLENDERDVASAMTKGGVPWLLTRWTSPSHRHRLVARFELFLDATRNARTRALIRRQRRTFLEAARTAFERAGSRDADLRGRLLVATVDGLLFDHLLGPKSHSGALRQTLTGLFFRSARA